MTEYEPPKKLNIKNVLAQNVINGTALVVVVAQATVYGIRQNKGAP